MPAAVQATLLDEGVYRCSTRTMYRILAEQGETRERRDQRRTEEETALAARAESQQAELEAKALVDEVRS